MVALTREEARVRAWALFRDLEQMAQRDPEQEVTGLALVTLDRCLNVFREDLEDPVVSGLAPLVTADFIGSASP